MERNAHQGKLNPSKDRMSPLAVESILDNSTTDFDLYLEVEGVLTLYAKAPYRWSRDELSRLLGSGYRNFFYFTSDTPRVETYKASLAIPAPDLALPPPQRIVNLTEAAAELTRILYEHPLTDSIFAKGQEIATAMVECVREDRTCVSAIGNLANHDYYTYYHSARVAAYALAIAMQLSLTEQESLEQMAIGCLLHDVGKSKIDLAVLNKRGALTKEEWELMRRHPIFGDELVANSLLAPVPRQIILHHHERFDGKGYPHGLTERELLEEVKIAAFADIFDALTTNRPYQVSRTKYEALDFIKHKLLANLHQDSYRAMVELLGEQAPKKKA